METDHTEGICQVSFAIGEWIEKVVARVEWECTAVFVSVPVSGQLVFSFFGPLFLFVYARTIGIPKLGETRSEIRIQRTRQSSGQTFPFRR